MATLTKEQLKEKVIRALEAGNDPGPYYEQLDAIEDAERKEHRRIEDQQLADQRKAWKQQAAILTGKINRQGAAIDTFLQKRDAIVKRMDGIRALLEELQELDKNCFVEIPNNESFWYGDSGKIPPPFLPENICAPMLCHNPGLNPRDIVTVAIMDLDKLLKTLNGAVKNNLTPMTTAKAITIVAVPDDNSDGDSKNCIVCQRSDLNDIDTAISNGVPLREIERSFGVSKSSLSRHSKHITPAMSPETGDNEENK